MIAMKKLDVFFVLRICGRIVHSVWVACMAWWRPAVQLLLTGVPRANFRRGVRPSISPRSKVITVRTLKLESSKRATSERARWMSSLRSFLRLAVSLLGTCPAARLWLVHWRKFDDAMWRHALYSLMHRQSGPSLLFAGQWSKMGLVVARLADDGLCPRCKVSPENLMHPGKRAVQVTVELVGPCRCQFFRTHCLARMRVQESRRQAWRCSPSKSPSVS